MQRNRFTGFDMLKMVFICALSLSFALVPSFCTGEDARIDEVAVSRNSGLSVSFSVKDAFTKEIEEAVRSGIPTAFTFIVKLRRVREFWSDEDLGVWRFKHTVRYDSLKDEYEIRRDETGAEVVRAKDIADMKKLMTVCPGVVLGSAAPLDKGQDYEIRVMAELRTVELPFILNYVLFFVKFWDVDTGWYTYRFSP